MNSIAGEPARSGRVRSLHERIFSLCADGESVYTVLDGASIAGLIDHLAAHKPLFTSLYSGLLDPELTACAPYLVRLARECEFTWLVLESGWGEHWGVFAVSGSDITTMRRHFRTLLRVKDPAGKIMYFRFYDPRALRVFLPTCDKQELAAMFGPITTYIAEDADASTLLRFQRGRHELEIERSSLEQVQAK